MAGRRSPRRLLLPWSPRRLPPPRSPRLPRLRSHPSRFSASASTPFPPASAALLPPASHASAAQLSSSVPAPSVDGSYVQTIDSAAGFSTSDDLLSRRRLEIRLGKHPQLSMEGSSFLSSPTMASATASARRSSSILAGSSVPGLSPSSSSPVELPVLAATSAGVVPPYCQPTYAIPLVCSLPFVPAARARANRRLRRVVRRHHRSVRAGRPPHVQLPLSEEFIVVLKGRFFLWSI